MQLLGLKMFINAPAFVTDITQTLFMSARQLFLPYLHLTCSWMWSHPSLGTLWLPLLDTFSWLFARESHFVLQSSSQVVSRSPTQSSSSVCSPLGSHHGLWPLTSLSRVDAPCGWVPSARASPPSVWSSTPGSDHRLIPSCWIVRPRTAYVMGMGKSECADSQ